MFYKIETLRERVCCNLSSILLDGDSQTTTTREHRSTIFNIAAFVEMIESKQKYNCSFKLFRAIVTLVLLGRESLFHTNNSY